MWPNGSVCNFIELRDPLLPRSEKNVENIKLYRGTRPRWSVWHLERRWDVFVVVKVGTTTGHIHSTFKILPHPLVMLTVCRLGPSSSGPPIGWLWNVCIMRTGTRDTGRGERLDLCIYFVLFKYNRCHLPQ